MNDKLTDRFFIIAAHILERRPVTVSFQECADVCGISKTNADRVLNILRDRGLVGWHTGKYRTLDLTPKGEEFYKRWKRQ